MSAHFGTGAVTDQGHTVGAAVPHPVEVRRRAARTLAGNAVDAEELAEWLRMFDLRAEEGH